SLQSPRWHGGGQHAAATVKCASGDRRPGYLARIEPEIETVAVIAAAELAAAFLVIVERHDPRIDLRTGRHIDELGLIAIVDIALYRDLMPPRGNIAIRGAAGHRNGGNRAIDPNVGARHRLVRVLIAIEPDPRLLDRHRRDRGRAGQRQ